MWRIDNFPINHSSLSIFIASQLVFRFSTSQVERRRRPEQFHPDPHNKNIHDTFFVKGILGSSEAANSGRSFHITPNTIRDGKGCFSRDIGASFTDHGEISGWGKKRFSQNSNFQQQDGIMKNANRHRQTRVRSHPRNNKNLCARKRARMRGARGETENKTCQRFGEQHNRISFFQAMDIRRRNDKKYAHDTPPHQHRLPLRRRHPLFQRKQRNSEAQRKFFAKYI